MNYESYFIIYKNTSHFCKSSIIKRTHSNDRDDSVHY